MSKCTFPVSLARLTTSRAHVNLQMDTESSNVLHKNKRGQRLASEASANAASANAASGSGKVDWSKVEELDVLLRPWLRIDGSLNRRVFDRLLGAVLGQGSTDISK